MASVKQRCRGRVLLLLLCGALAAAAAAPEAERFGDAITRPVVDGEEATIPAPDSKATVLLFLSSDCPIANKYAPEIRRIQEQFEPRGTAFVRVYDDRYHDADDLREHTRDYAYAMPAILDVDSAIVKRCRATVTPEAVVLGEDGVILYRGRIDDRYADFGRYRQVASEHDLIDALTAALQGEAPAHPRTKAIGCFIPGTGKPDAPDE